MKNIVVIVGSPRKNGNTELLADAFIEGARGAGNTVEKISVKKSRSILRILRERFGFHNGNNFREAAYRLLRS